MTIILQKVNHAKMFLPMPVEQILLHKKYRAPPWVLKLEILQLGVLHPWCFPHLGITIAPLAICTSGFSPVQYLQLKERFFNGITLPEVRPMDVESEWIGPIKQSLEGSSDHSPQS